MTRRKTYLTALLFALIVGFNGNIYKKEENEYESLSGFINSKSLYGFQPDEFEIEDIKLAVKQDFTNLFETE